MSQSTRFEVDKVDSCFATVDEVCISDVKLNCVYKSMEIRSCSHEADTLLDLPMDTPGLSKSSLSMCHEM